MNTNMRYITLQEFYDYPKGLTVTIGGEPDKCFRNEDALKNFIVKQETRLDRYIGRRLDLTSHTEEFCGRDQKTYFPTNIPVTEVTNMVVYSTSQNEIYTGNFDIDLLYLNSDGTYIKYENGFVDGYNYRLTYNGGYSIIPEDIKEAVILLATYRLYETGRGIIHSESYFTSKNVYRDTPHSGLYPEIQSLLEPFKRKLLYN